MKSPKFLRKLAWRDMSYWLLTLWPDLPSVPTRVHYRVGGLQQGSHGLLIGSPRTQIFWAVKYFL